MNISRPETMRYPEGLSWYVVYARSRSEKKVAERLERAGITCFLPLLKVMRQWSDRRKMVEVPMFSGYLLCTQNLPVLQTYAWWKGGEFCSLGGRNAIVPEDQIRTIQLFVETGLPGESGPDDLIPGERVQVTFGPLAGCTGELLEVRNQRRFVVRIEVYPAGAHHHTADGISGTNKLKLYIFQVNLS